MIRTSSPSRMFVPALCSLVAITAPYFAWADTVGFAITGPGTYALSGVKTGDVVQVSLQIDNSGDTDDPSEDEGLSVAYPGGSFTVLSGQAAKTGVFTSTQDDPTISASNFTLDGDEVATFTANFTSSSSENPQNYDPKDAGPPPCDEQCSGDPINTGNGNAFQGIRDYSSAGPFALRFERFYNSLDVGNGLRPLGSQWTHTYDRWITVDSSGNAVVHLATGQGLTFQLQPDGTYTPDANVFTTLSQTSGGGWVYRNDQDGTELYNSAGQLTSLSDRTGYVHVLGYDSSGRLAKVSDPFGRTLQFAYDPLSRISTVTDPAGKPYQYSYDGSNNLTGVIYPDQTSVQYLYEDPATPHGLTGIIDENGKRYATWAYASGGRATLSELANGANATYVNYNTDGSSFVSNAIGKAQNNTFSFLQRAPLITSVTRQCPTCTPASHSVTYYSSAGIRSSSTDYNNDLTQYNFNNAPSNNFGLWGLPDSITKAANTPQAETTSYTWSSDFRLPTEIKLGNVNTNISDTGFVYDNRGRLKTKFQYAYYGNTPTSHNVWSYTYENDGLDKNGNPLPGPLTSKTDPLNHETSFTYDGQQNLSTKTDLLGHATRITLYDPHGRPLTIFDENNVETDLSYDLRGRLTSITAGGEITLFGHDNAGNLTSVTKPATGAKLTYGYDDAHRLISISDNLGNVISYTLDAMGNRTYIATNPGTAFPTYQQGRAYDTFSRLTTIFGLTANKTFSYDRNGNVVKYQLAYPETAFTQGGLGPATLYAYDSLNRLYQVTDGLGKNTVFGFNAVNAVGSIQDPNNHTTSYGFDPYLGTPATETSPDRGSSSYVYDEALNRINLTDGNGSKSVYGYDVLNRLTSAQTPTSAANYNLYYDETTSAYGVGRLTRVVDASGTITYAYTARGKIASETHAIGGHSYTVSYSYDGDDRLVGISYPSGRTITYTLDVMGRTTAVSSKLGGSSQTLASFINYEPFGPLLNLRYGNGLTLQKQFDSIYQPLDVDVVDPSGTNTSPLIQQDVPTDEDDIGELVYSNTGTQVTQNFAWDADHRLTTSQSSTSTSKWTYDANGNRLTQTSGRTNTTYAIDSASNRLLSFTGGTSYAYDKNGNVLSKGSNSFIYDAANRLTQIKSGTKVAASYTYNAFNQRASKTVGSTTTVYLYDRNGHLIAEINGSTGATNIEYVHLDSMPLAIFVTGSKSSVSTYYVHLNYLNTPQAVTDSTGATVWQANYDSFGNVSLTASKITFNLRFPGQYYDAESGLHYNWNRYYDPQTGRYLSPDPVGMNGGLNPYAYARGNPLKYTDASGLLLDQAAYRLALERAAAAEVAGLGPEDPVADIAAALVFAITLVAAIDAPDNPANSASKPDQTSPATSSDVPNDGGGNDEPPASGSVCAADEPSPSKKTPNTGPAGDWYTNPGSGQQRLYGPDGYPEVDLDFDHVHDGLTPHAHNWISDPNGGFPSRGPGVPFSPVPPAGGG